MTPKSLLTIISHGVPVRYRLSIGPKAGMVAVMVDRIPIRSAAMLDTLNSDEVVEGYFDGRQNEPEPGDNRSFSYWHGWRNGMVDGHHAETDEAGSALARDAIESGYLANLKISA